MAGFWIIRQRNAAKSETLEAVIEGPIVEAVYAIGKIEAVRRFQAKAGVPSGISKLPVREGTSVQRFDPLVHFVEGTIIRAPFSGIVSRVNYKVSHFDISFRPTLLESVRILRFMITPNSSK